MVQDDILRQKGLKPQEQNDADQLQTNGAVPILSQTPTPSKLMEDFRTTGTIETYGTDDVATNETDAEDENASLEQFLQQREEYRRRQEISSNALSWINSTPVDSNRVTSSTTDLSIKEQVEDTAKILGVSSDEAVKFTKQANNVEWNVIATEHARQRIDELIGKSLENDKKPQIPERRLHNNIVANYFEGVENLSKYQFNEVAKALGDNFKEKSKEEQNLALKRAIVEDIFTSSKNDEYRDVWEVISQDPSMQDEATLDALFKKWYIQYGTDEMSSNKANFWRQFRNTLDFSRSSATMHKPEDADLKNTEDKLDYYLDRERAAIRQKEESKAEKKNALTDLKAQRRLQQRVFDEIDNLTSTKKEEYKNAFYNEADYNQKSAIDSFKRHSRDLSSKFKKYENTPYLPLTDDDYAELLSKYQSDAEVGGEGYADERLQRSYQDIVAENTSGWETLSSVVNTGLINFMTSGAGSLLAKTAYAAWNYVENAATELDFRYENFSNGWEEAKKALAVMQHANVWAPWKADEAWQAWQEGTGPVKDTNYSSAQEDTFWSTKTIGDLASQTGYIAGFSNLGGITGKIVGSAAHGLAKGTAWAGLASNAITAENKAAAFKKIASAMTKGGAVTNQLIMGMANASLESSGIKYDFMQQSHLEKEREIKQNFERDLMSQIQNNLEAYINAYIRETGLPIGYLAPVSNDSNDLTRVYSENDFMRLYTYFAEKPELYEGYRDQYQQDYELHMAKAEAAATAGATTTYVMNVLPEMVLNATLRKSLLPKSFQRWSTATDTKISEKLSLVLENGKWTAKMVPYAKKFKALDYLDRIKGEFLDEASENIFSTVGNTVAETALSDMLFERYGNHPSTSAYAYDLSYALGQGLSEIPGAVFDQETIMSGIYGGLSSAMGILTLNSKLDWSKKKDGENWITYAKRINPIAWDSIISLPFSDSSVEEENAQREKLAEYIATFLSDEKQQRLFMDSVAMSSMMQKLNMAVASGDAKAVQDAEFDVIESAISTLSSLKGTDYYDSVMSIINNRAGFNPENLNDPESLESKAVQEYYESEGANSKKDAKEVVKEMAKNAKGLLNMIQFADSEMDDILSTFGEDVDVEFAQSILKNRMKSRDRQLRMDEMQQRIDKKLSNGRHKGGTRSNLSDAMKRFMASYGTTYSMRNGQKIYEFDEYLAQKRQEISQKIAEVYADKSLNSSTRKAKIKKLEKEYSKMEKEIANYGDEVRKLNKDQLVISAEEILAMDPIDRALFLSRESHSIEQKKEIKKLDHVKEDLITYGELRAEYDYHNQVDGELLLNPVFYGDYYNKVKKAARQEVINSKYEYLNNPDLTYEEFRTAVLEASRDMGREDVLLLDNTIKKNGYYKRFETDESAYISMRQAIESTQYYDDIKDINHKNNVNAVLTAMHDKGITLDENTDIDTLIEQVTEIVNSPDYAKLLDRHSEPGTQAIASSPESVAQSIRSIYNEIIETKEEVRKRNAEQIGTDASGVDNNPMLSPLSPTEETTEEEENEEIKPVTIEKSEDQEVQEDESIEQGVDIRTQSLPSLRSLLEKFAASNPKIGNYDQRNRQRALNWISSALDDFEKYGKEGDTPWAHMTDLEKGTNNADKALIMAVRDAFKEYVTGEKIGNKSVVYLNPYPQGKAKDFLRRTRSFETIANIPSIHGKVYFYTPQELIEENGELPVVAMLQVSNGEAGNKKTIQIGDRYYQPIGMVTPTEKMVKENSNRKGNFLYSESATIEVLQKDAFGKDQYEADTPVSQAVEASSTISGESKERKFKAFLSKLIVTRDGNNGKKQLAYPVKRGRGNEEIGAEIYVTPIKKVLNAKGLSAFGVAKQFNGASPEAKVGAAQQLVDYNAYFKMASDAIRSAFNSSDDILMTLSKDPNADVSKQLRKMWRGINNGLRVPNYSDYKLELKNISVNSAGKVSFDLVLSHPTYSEMQLFSGVELSPSNSLSKVQIAEILYNLMYTTKGEARDSWLRYPVNFQITNAKTKEVTLDEKSIRRAYDNGVLTTNHKNFDNLPGAIGIIMSQPAEEKATTTELGISNSTDTAAPIKSSSTDIQTIEGERIDPDTGTSLFEKEEELGDEYASIETSLDNEVSQALEEVGEDVYLDDEEGADLFQAIANRKKMISRVREFFQKLVKDVTGKEAFAEIKSSIDARFAEDTKINAFEVKSEQDRRDARALAEKRAAEIRKMDLPSVKSISVVRNGSTGYSIKISHYDYERYIDRTLNSVEDMSNETLRKTIAAFDDVKSVMNPSNEELERHHSIFGRFGTKSLRKKFLSGQMDSASKRFEKLLSDVVSAFNIKVFEKDLRDVNGDNIAGAISSAGDIVYLAKGGKRNNLTLAEETSHALIKHITREDSPVDQEIKDLYSDIALDIEDTTLYQEVLDEYKDIYRDEDSGEIDYRKIKEEAIGKALAVTLQEKYDREDSLKEKVLSLFENIVDYIKYVASKHNLTKGTEAILQYKANSLVSKLLDNKVSEVKKATSQSVVSSILKALGIDNKTKHVKSEGELSIEKKTKDVMKRSASYTIKYDFLPDYTKERLESIGISDDTWQEYPKELQQQLLKCLSIA